MRAQIWMTLAATAAILAACGQKTEAPAASNQTASTPAAPSAPAANPFDTPEAKKALAELPDAYQKADLQNGQSQFAVCRSCHTLNKGGANMTGPNLYGVFGRKAGAAEGFNYSDGLKALGSSWDADKLNAWIKDPKSVVATTKMSYVGMKDDKNRTDLIAYLKVATSGAAQ